MAEYAGQRAASRDNGPDTTVHERAVQLRITAAVDMSLIVGAALITRDKGWPALLAVTMQVVPS